MGEWRLGSLEVGENGGLEVGCKEVEENGG